MSSYTLNPEAAKQADQMGGMIKETGKYAGHFTRAESITSTKGTKGVEFSFKSADGLTADYLTLWTINAEGKELYGYKTLMAIMTCLKVRDIKPVRQEIEKYDHELQCKAPVMADVFQELTDKSIGLLLEREEYRNGRGEVKSKMVIAAPFDPATSFTASEILNKAVKPEILDKMVAQLRDRPLKDVSTPSQGAPVAAGNDEFDDLPF